MRPFTVEWLEDAEGQLAAAWTQAQDRHAVVQAQDTIDRLLGQYPLVIGEEVKEGLRKLTVDPLVAYYEVNSGTHTVKVSAVAFIG